MRIFGSGAFFDLAPVGYQATKATNLSIRQQCIAATPEKDGKIVFSWYDFLREVVKQDDAGNSGRAFFVIVLNQTRSPKVIPLVMDSIPRSLIRTAISKDSLSFKGSNYFAWA
jgi:hypothetical protein